MFVGMNDTWSVEQGALWTLDKLPEDTEYHLLNSFDHSTYGIGKDMSYFKRVLELLNIHNPL